MHRYVQEFDGDEHAERFLDATHALLERKGLLPPKPIHLGFEPVGAADEYDRTLDAILERTKTGSISSSAGSISTIPVFE